MNKPSKPAKAAMAARMALLMEAAAEKPGNVTPTRGFEEMDFTSFIISSQVVGDLLARAANKSVGWIILNAVTDAMKATGANTHLGAILLLAPLAHAFLKSGTLSARSTGATLAGLTTKDAVMAYKAIRLASPGGLGRAPQQDTRRPPTVTLLEAMKLAAERDLIAREYSTGFSITFGLGAPEMEANIGAGLAPLEAVTQTFLTIMSRHPDTLISRKNEPEMANKASEEAARILSLGGMHSARGRRAVYEFDQALRIESNLLNPGATADLTAAALFVYFIRHGYGSLNRGGKK
ncbi:MAG: triphosphoribosyl-dephospho-CoA synthase [Nitrospinota bacterium]|nr:triphosphoribosyl-dephospho-CoA synthase [Nitrospinota bacterium]